MTRTYDQVAGDYGRSFDLNFDRQMPSYQERLHNNSQNNDPLHFIVTKKPAEVKIESFTTLILKITCFMSIVAAIFYLSANWFGGAVSKAGHTTDTSIKRFSIEKTDLMVPLNMVRFSQQRKSGTLKRLDLYAHWPSLSGYSEKHAQDFDSLKDDAPLIFISLEPQTMSQEMSGRIEGIYNKFFAGPAIEAGNGLVRRAFSADSAYFSEDLYYEVNSPYPFATRCIRENDKVAASFCIRDIIVGNGLSLTYRFHSSLLPQWRDLESAIRAKYKTMIVK